MAQQINLYSPILLQPRRYFSALAMLQALGALLLGLLVIGGWVEFSTAQQQRELASTTAAQSAERQRLQAELASRPAAPKDTTALEQELAQARQAVVDRQHLLAEFASPAAQASRAAVLRLVAQTAPDKLWLTEVHLSEDRLELVGISLQPEQLRPWIALLLAQPALRGLVLRTVVVDATDAAARDSRETREMGWSFRVVAQPPVEASASPTTGMAQAPGNTRPAREGAP